MRRGFMLLAVMIGLGLALVAAMAILQLAQVETSGAFHTTQRAQAHALARSGIDAIAGELAAQREDILAGRMPRLEEQYVIYEADGRLGVVRLLPVGASDSVIESETGKLDINEVSAEQLVATGVVEEELASRIIQLRDKALGRPIRSLCELAHVPGMTNELLFGPLERLERPFGELMGGELDEFDPHGRDNRILERRLSDGGDKVALANVLTVYSIEADVRMDGSPRIDLSTSRRIEERSDDENAADRTSDPAEPPRDLDVPGVLSPLVAGGATYREPSEIASILMLNNVPPEEWPEYFETCTTQPGALRHGRIDINTAPLEALLGVPGFTVEHAEAIASAQETLTDVERATVCWPLLAGIIEPEPFSEALDHIINRSWCYRVRIAAGEVKSDEPGDVIDAPVIYEIVFDLASNEPRVAYLRDITLMPTMLAMAARSEGDADPFDLRTQSHALDDELIAWNEAYGDKDELGAEAGAEESADNDALPPPTLPSQPSLPDFPSLPTMDDVSEDGQPIEEAGSAVDRPGRNGAEPAQAPPVRRLGRWQAGSS